MGHVLRKAGNSITRPTIRWTPVRNMVRNSEGGADRESWPQDDVDDERLYIGNLIIIIIIIIIDRFYIALFSALEQTHCARM